jgi:thiol-disulfide isomerase/thioredoxin
MTDQSSPSPIPPTIQPKSGISPILIVLLVIPLLGIAAALGLLVADQPSRTDTTDNTRPRSAIAVLDKAVEDFTLITLDGETVQMSQYAGRPIFFNFWGTWCPPCVEELPVLEAFAKAQAALPDGAVVIASNNTESSDQIRAYFAENDLEVPHILFVQDTDSLLYRWFGVFQRPTTYVIDSTQRIRLVKYGEFNAQSVRDYFNEVQALE